MTANISSENPIKLLSQKDIAIQFHKNKIVELKEIELSSGKKSPYYMDMRGLLAFPNLISDVVERLVTRINESGVQFDKFASVPVGAVPFASMLAARMGKPSVLVRDQPKQHGTKKLIEGRLGIDDRVILIEDVITTGASVLKTIQKLKNRGAEVVAVWSLCNREEGGIENIAYEYKDIPVYSLFTTTDIFSPLVKEKTIAAYDWERIKFFQESQFKDMIRHLRERNTAKQEPEWETNRALYFASRFPFWIAAQPETPSNLIISLARPRIMTSNQIIHILAKNRVPVPLIHTNGNAISPENLNQWNKETGGKVIIDSGSVLGWNDNKLLSDLDKFDAKSCFNGTESADDIKYEIAANNILISSLADIESAITNLALHNESYVENGQSKKFIVLSFNKVNVKELINDDKIWAGLDKLVIAMTGNNLSCCGVAFMYSDIKYLTTRRDLWKRAPVCLWVDDWHLHPSMVDKNGVVDTDHHKSWTSMTSVLEKLKPWQIIMDEDVISSQYPIIDRIGQYSQFFKSEQITGLITDIREKIYKQTTTPAVTNESASQIPTNGVASDTDNNAIHFYKSAVRYFNKVREPAVSKTNKTKILGKNQKVTHEGKLNRITANEICQNIYQYCTEQIIIGYTFIGDVIAKRTSNSDDKNKKMN